MPWSRCTFRMRNLLGRNQNKCGLKRFFLFTHHGSRHICWFCYFKAVLDRIGLRDIVISILSTEKVTPWHINLVLVTHRHRMLNHRSKVTKLDLWNAAKWEIILQVLAFPV